MIILFIVVGCVLVYSVLPNLLTRWLHLGVLWKGPERPEIALTFDDGPDSNHTVRLLDALKSAGLPATFFVIAHKAVAHPHIIERMIAEGHEVEVHGWRHWFVPILPPWSALRQVRKSSKVLRERFGIETRLYRPTWGAYNLSNLLDASFNGHRTVTWSVMVGDWRVTPAHELMHRIERKWGRGAVIVLHDSDETLGAQRGAPLQVIELIPELAKRARDAGYTFVRMSEWMESMHSRGKEGD